MRAHRLGAAMLCFGFALATGSALAAEPVSAGECFLAGMKANDADAVAACERAQSTTPFKWTEGKKTAVIGVSSVKLNKDTIIPSYTLVADSVFCDYDPIKKKADIGSNFLERETF